ncbi:bifunctional riboflavin kinase/FAD synthetase [Lacrimispora sp. NSJ-141]|uniref:Riboflavin biosynthesis protein n=1 Tax=Lientehia hominis TaxID=2897778 RepID=A0AAP2W9D1_9FIRM|nr:bifunctional riboflavin kinase/FAD synthetase [Lientehia hominis]MCD2491604.1 bifunctional riboflavin kinase/FAD synthetase [Lientehia hominis]
MEVITGRTEICTVRPSAVTLGKFDGIHRGHQKLINELFLAREQGLQAVVFTFLRPPKSLVDGGTQPVLLTNREKRAHMEKLGVELMIEYPFTEEVHHMEPEYFVEKILAGGLKARKIITGPDFCFGYKRRGNVELLKELAPRYGYEVEVMDKAVTEDGQIISSTLIRRELLMGNVEQANELLGYPYTVTGEVVHGNHLGRTFGMPTINQIPVEDKLLPPNGVYVSKVEIDGLVYQSVSNVGYKPTIAGKYPKGVETYIFGFDKDVYGRILDVQLFHYLRKEEKFSSVAALKAQLQRDAEGSLAYFEQQPEV